VWILTFAGALAMALAVAPAMTLTFALPWLRLGRWLSHCSWRWQRFGAGHKARYANHCGRINRKYQLKSQVSTLDNSTANVFG